MPIYEYRCDACGQEMEKIQKFSDPAIQDCPECGKPSLVKLVSASSFRLKGSGWYETDFKTGNKKNGVTDSSSNESSSSGTSGSDDKKTPDKTSKPKSEAKKESS